MMKLVSFFIFSFVVSCSFAANARPLIADLSLRQIEIDSRFAGTDILFFGARNEAGNIVIVIRGPKKSYIVRKKEKTLGIWVNKKHVVFDEIYDFYTVAASQPLDEIKNDLLLQQLEIGMENVRLSARKGFYQTEQFDQAILRQKQDDNLYLPFVKEVSFMGETLFRSIIRFPENIPRGTYTAEIYLFSDGQLVGVQTTPLIINKTGFDAFVFDLAYRHSLLYGIIAVVMALLAGWVAGLIFRRVG